MELEKLSLFTVVKKRLAWLARRQEVIAQNIANADTPAYRARDLKPLQFRDMVRNQKPGISMKVTSASHLRGIAKRASEFFTTRSVTPDSRNCRRSRCMSPTRRAV